MAEVKKKVKKGRKNKDDNAKQGIRWYLVVLWSLFVIGVTCGFGLFYGISHEWFGDMPTFEELENPSTNLASEIISADGKILGTYYIENRSNVSYSELSPHLVEALLAIEDIRFYEHSGIDQRALFRVVFGIVTDHRHTAVMNQADHITTMFAQEKFSSHFSHSLFI